MYVKVSELYEAVEDMHKNGYKYVDISILDRDTDPEDGSPIPASLSLTALDTEAEAGIDYDLIDEVPDSDIEC